MAVVAKVLREKQGHQRPEVMTIDEAAEYLRIKPSTLWKKISNGKFTAADGLRHIHGATRILFAVLRERLADDTLMKEDTEPERL